MKKSDVFIAFLLVLVIAVGAILLYVVLNNNKKTPVEDASVSDTDTNNLEGESLEKYDTDFYVEEGLAIPADTTNL